MVSEFSPCGVAPLRLEGRFDALDQYLEAATPSPCYAMAVDVSLNRGIEIDQSQGMALLGTGEGTILDRECSDSPTLGDRPIDFHWPLGSLVKWKSLNHLGLFEYDFGIVSRRAEDRRWIERDDRP